MFYTIKYHSFYGSALFYFCWNMDSIGSDMEGQWSKGSVKKRRKMGCVILWFFSPFHMHLSLGVFTSFYGKLSHLQFHSQFVLISCCHPNFPGRSRVQVFPFNKPSTASSSTCSRAVMPFTWASGLS